MNEGKELIKKYNCVGCHEIESIQKEFTPSLDGIGSKVSRQWLVRWLKDPYKVLASTRMPNFNLSDEEIEVLGDFLISFKNFPAKKELEHLPEILREEIPDNLYEKGETLFRNARCISCHLVDGKGGRIAMEIGMIASKANRRWIYNFLKYPGTMQPEIKMSYYNFSEEEHQAITGYISSEFIDWDAPEEQDTIVHIPDPNYYEKGLALFQKYNCSGCHNLNNIPAIENFGLSLSDMRDKPSYLLEFGEKNIPHTKENYIVEKLKDPRGFLPNALMPMFKFNEHEIQAITTAVLSFQKKPIPELYSVKTEQTPSITLGGEFGELVEKYQCLTCHKIFNQGESLAPDLTRSGSRLKSKWIKEYFRLPYSLRPILTERMPNFFMSEKEIDILTDYISMVFRDDSLETYSEFKFPKAQIERGENLYYNTYGCQSCHQIGDKGGYVGQPLDNLNTRLKTGWVYKRMRDTHHYNPGITEPEYLLSHEEAEDLTAFLLSGKK